MSHNHALECIGCVFGITLQLTSKPNFEILEKFGEWMWPSIYYQVLMYEWLDWKLEAWHCTPAPSQQSNCQSKVAMSSRYLRPKFGFEDPTKESDSLRALRSICTLWLKSRPRPATLCVLPLDGPWFAGEGRASICVTIKSWAIIRPSCFQASFLICVRGYMRDYYCKNTENTEACVVLSYLLIFFMGHW